MQKIKSLDSGKGRMWRKTILKDRDGVCECIIPLLFLLTSTEEKDQVISVVLSKLAKKDIERSRSGGVKAGLIQEVVVT